MGICTPEHRSACSGGSLGGAAAPPYLGGSVAAPALIHKPPFIRNYAFLSVTQLGVVVRYNFRSKIYFPARPERNKV
jgi:hypothetical protein